MQFIESLWRHTHDAFNPQREMPLAMRHPEKNLLGAIVAAGREPPIRL